MALVWQVKININLYFFCRDIKSPSNREQEGESEADEEIVERRMEWFHWGLRLRGL